MGGTVSYQPRKSRLLSLSCDWSCDGENARDRGRDRGREGNEIGSTLTVLLLVCVLWAVHSVSVLGGVGVRRGSVLS